MILYGIHAVLEVVRCRRSAARSIAEGFVAKCPQLFATLGSSCHVLIARCSARCNRVRLPIVAGSNHEPRAGASVRLRPCPASTILCHRDSLYTRIAKKDIRRNRDNIGERLGFLGRVIHDANPRAWLKEIQPRLGQRMDFALAVRIPALVSDNMRLVKFYPKLPAARFPANMLALFHPRQIICELRTGQRK